MEDSSENQASLTVLGGPKAGLRFVIEDSVDNIVIGSDPSCRFHIDLPGVSPVHARLWIDPQGVTVYETNSPRGLYINDDRVVAQAQLRNGDILWLGTPGDEDVVMIQCRLPQTKAKPRAAPPPLDQVSVRETVALGSLAPRASDAAAVPEVEPEPEATPEPEVEPDPEVVAEPKPDATPASEPTPAASFAPTPPPSTSPPTEAFMVDEPPSGSPARAPVSPPVAEPAPFELDFTTPMPPFEADRPAAAPPPVQVEASLPPVDEGPTAAQLERPAPPPRPPSYPPPAAARPREMPQPIRAEAPPPPRRPAARPPTAMPTASGQEPPARPASAAIKYGLIGVGIVLIAAGSFVAVRLLRPPATDAPSAPPTTVAMAPPSAAPAPVETPPASAEPAPPTTIPEEVVVVPQSTPTPVPVPAASAPPTPAPRPTATQRPTPKPAMPSPPRAASPTPGAAAPPVPQAPTQVASLLGQAAAAVSGRQFDAALQAFDEVLKVDPQNASAIQGKAAAQAAATSYKRSFAAGRTSLSGKEGKADLGGFDTAGVKVAKVPDYSGRIEFEVTPPRVLPGDAYTVRIFLLNDGKKVFKISSVNVATLVNGSRSGGPVSARVREIEPRDRVLLDERRAEWAAGTNSWTLETVVSTDRGATFTNRLNWR